MNGLQSHCHLEPSRNPRSELQGLRAHRAGVRFDGDSAEWLRYSRYSLEILSWNRVRIKKIAGVIKLEPLNTRNADRAQYVVELAGECSGRRWSIEGAPPQIAERTRERTLGAGQKHGERFFHHITGAALLLSHMTVR